MASANVIEKFRKLTYRVPGNWPNSYTWIGYHRLIGPPRALLSINVDHDEAVPT